MSSRELCCNNKVETCDIPGCKNEYVVQCDCDLGWVTFGWRSCDKKLCKDHRRGIKSSRCYSDPPSECQIYYENALRKQRCIYSLCFLVLFGALFVAIFFIFLNKKDTISFKSHTIANPYWSMYYKVKRDDNGDVYLNPKTDH